MLVVAFVLQRDSWFFTFSFFPRTVRFLYVNMVWVGAPNRPACTASLVLMAHHQNLSSIRLRLGYYCGRCSSALAKLVSLYCSQWRLLIILLCCTIFFVTIPRCCKDVNANSFLCLSGILCSFLLAGCFHLICKLNCFKFQVTRDPASFDAF